MLNLRIGVFITGMDNAELTVQWPRIGSQVKDEHDLETGAGRRYLQVRKYQRMFETEQM